MEEYLYIGSKDDSACRAIDDILDQALKKPSENSATSFFMGAADDVTLKNIIKVESVKSSAECDQQVVEAFKEAKAAMQKSTGLMTQFGTDVEDAMVYTLLSNMYRKMTAPLTKKSEATYPSEFQFGNHVLCTVNNILRDGYSEKTIVDYASEVLRNDNSSYYMLEYQMELCVQYKTLVVKTVNSLLHKSPDYKPIGEGNLFSTDKEFDLVSDASHAMYGCVNLLDSSIEVITSYIDKQNATRFGLKPAVKEPEEVMLEEKEIADEQMVNKRNKVKYAIKVMKEEGYFTGSREKHQYAYIYKLCFDGGQTGGESLPYYQSPGKFIKDLDVDCTVRTINDRLSILKASKYPKIEFTEKSRKGETDVTEAVNIMKRFLVTYRDAGKKLN